MIVRVRFVVGCACTVLTVQVVQAADCSSTYDCTVDAGSYTSPYGLDSTGTNGSQDDNPGSGSSITITNNGTFSVNAGSQGYALHAQSSGGQPVDESTGGAGGAISITNNGGLTLSQGTYGSELIGIDAWSVGADADRDNQNNGSPGGDGGASGNIIVNNSGAINVGPSLSHGGIGIYGLAQGGDGGEGNTDFGVNQPGGDGGTPGTISITNGADITMGTSSTPISSGSRAWGIRAESNGGGGDPDPNTGDNDPAGGHGAAGNTVTITNNAAISLHVAGNGSTSGGVKGVYASS
ncbi:MAG TPA: hypothetical protein VHL31_21570, partial [Geminicoccus sp.]|nr:hypothetical protein [Geminicoccus sp.]